jgi:hypothetical protein
MDPEDALNDCMVGSGPCPSTGEYDTHWDETKLREKFSAGDKLFNMELRLDTAFYEYQEARMVIQYEAEQRRAAGAPVQQSEQSAIAPIRPDPIMRLWRAAKVYAHNYMQDEAEPEDDPADLVCSPEQHAEAVEVFAAIAELEQARASIPPAPAATEGGEAGADWQLVVDAGAEVLYGHTRAEAREWVKEDKFDSCAWQAEAVWDAMQKAAKEVDHG